MYPKIMSFLQQGQQELQWGHGGYMWPELYFVLNWVFFVLNTASPGQLGGPAPSLAHTPLASS